MEKHMIQAKKMMLTIACNFLKFHVVDLFPKRKIFNTTHSIAHILKLILALLLKSRRHHFVIHADNAKPNIAKKFHIFCDSHSLRIIYHPPYSLDLAPSDFYLFEYLKHFLRESFYPSEEVFVLGIHTIVSDIMDHFAKRVHELDGQISLSCHT
jgi:histone-lysine N-methyltransferase SETMAR